MIMNEQSSNESLANEQLKIILQTALMVAGEPLTVERLAQLFEEPQRPALSTLRDCLTELTQEQAELGTQSGLQLVELASGYCWQAKTWLVPWLKKLWEERPTRYSRALLETLALIAYRQPITRAEIEEVRGVAVSSALVKTLLEREWIRIVGHRDVPGKPALYATTRQFLDHFNLKNLGELPPLTEFHDPEKMNIQLAVALEEPEPSPEIIALETIATDLNPEFREEAEETEEQVEEAIS
jgi:segregation and condensation protein B